MTGFGKPKEMYGPGTKDRLLCIIRKYLTLYKQIFERDLDDKDAILQMLDRDITEAEEHYNIALTNHFIHVKQLMASQDSRNENIIR